MRIAITHAYSWPEVRRGAERIIRELGRALAARGHEVTVLTAGRRAETRHEDGVTTIRLRRHFKDDVRHEREFGWRLVPQLLRRKFDVVHSFVPNDVVAAIRTAKIRHHRTVYTQLGVPLRSWWDTRPDGAAHRRVVKDVDVYGCMSHYALDALASEYGRTDGVWLPGGVDLEIFKPMPREERATILFSGAVYEVRKGLPILLEALPKVAEVHPDVQLWISGPGDATPYLDAAPPGAAERTVVLPLGEPDGQAERYARAWTTALPSKGDSFGMVLAESLACGTPITASTHSALPELVDPGVTGALCDPDDADTVAAALITSLALAQRAETAEACRDSARQFDWRTGIAPDFERYYAG
ncbi:MAG TPA: glycosyltransferase family 4 protein [Acidimicrobiales bacterium]|nr:glycosyltransferase family 4 protein [Acidimicrobiales bacterium]